MSTDDLLSILNSVASKNKILLTDSDESLEKVENLIKFNDDLIHIVRSKNIAEIVAAVLSFSPERNLNENILSMNDSIASCNATLINLDSVEENMKLERIFSKMDNGDSFKDSFVSIYYSDVIPSEKVALLKSFMTTELNVPEVEVISVKTTLYDFLISIE
jgi:dihydroxyacetone kinase-like predicted kinase